MEYTEDEAAIVAEAERLYGTALVTFNAAPQPEVSYGADGAYVQAWVFVPWDRRTVIRGTMAELAPSEVR